MNKEELKEMFNNIEIGDYFYNLKIEGVKEQDDTYFILQELARRNNVQFHIKMNYYKYENKKETIYKKRTIYEVIKPNKKFLDKRGYWGISISNKAKEFLKTLEEE